jgi:hypothetical protein
MSNYIKIRRTIQALQYCYPEQQIAKSTVILCLCDREFQVKYVNY